MVRKHEIQISHNTGSAGPVQRPLGPEKVTHILYCKRKGLGIVLAEGLFFPQNVQKA